MLQPILIFRFVVQIAAEDKSRYATELEAYKLKKAGVSSRLCLQSISEPYSSCVKDYPDRFSLCWDDIPGTCGGRGAIEGEGLDPQSTRAAVIEAEGTNRPSEEGKHLVSFLSFLGWTCL